MEIAPLNLLFALVLPVLWAAGAFAGWAALVGRRPRLAGVFAGLAVTGAYQWAFWWNEHRGVFPPVDAVHWLYYGSFGLTAVVAAEALAAPRRWWAKVPFWLLAFALLLVTATPILRHLRGEHPDLIPVSARDAWLTLGLALAGAMLLRAGLGRQGCAYPTTAVWVMGLTSAVSAAVVGMSGSSIAPFRVAAVGLALLPLLPLTALSAGPTALLSRWGSQWGRPHWHALPAPAITAWTALTAATLLACHLYDALTLTNLCLLAAAPLAGLLVPAKHRGWKPAALRIALTSAVLLAAAIPAGLAAVRAMGESSGY